MSLFYFTDKGGNYYELSSTTRIHVSEMARATTNPVESGKAITDNYIIEPRTITFSGIITNIRVIGQQEDRAKPVDQWINDIRQLRIKKELIDVYIDTLDIIKGCLITSFDIDKSKEQGSSGWNCSFVMQEILVSDRARIVDIAEPKPEVKDDVQGKSNSGNQTTAGTELVEVNTTLLNYKNFIGLVTGGTP